MCAIHKQPKGKGADGASNPLLATWHYSYNAGIFRFRLLSLSSHKDIIAGSFLVPYHFDRLQAERR